MAPHDVPATGAASASTRSKFHAVVISALAIGLVVARLACSSAPSPHRTMSEVDGASVAIGGGVIGGRGRPPHDASFASVTQPGVGSSPPERPFDGAPTTGTDDATPASTGADPPRAPVTPPPAPGEPAVVGRPIPEQAAPSAPVESPFAASSHTTSSGLVATDVGCAADTSADALDAYFSQRMGPVLGHDYQHVYALGGARFLWLFQDTFLDYSGTATNLGLAAFAHNTAMIQDGRCFTLLHRGSISTPASFEVGSGESRLRKWFWPMGGETFDGRVHVFWVEMQKDAVEPAPPNGLGWHPARTWLAVYDAATLRRLSWGAAPNSGVAPVYGYAVSSDDEYTYLFGNSFEQNLQREGGYGTGPHSATKMWLARVPRGQFGAPLEYRDGDGWTYDATSSTPILERYWAENPMQPRFLAGQWVAVTKVDGYWGDSISVDVANEPWGPWTTVHTATVSPRGHDPLMNTYHAHLLPLASGGSVIVSMSQNARDMGRDAWPDPSRYRLALFSTPLVAPPPAVEDVADDPSSTSAVATEEPESATTSAVVPTTSAAPAPTGAEPPSVAPSATTMSSTTSAATVPQSTVVDTVSVATAPVTTAAVTTVLPPTAAATTISATTIPVTTISVTTISVATNPLVAVVADARRP